jgi:hypothetical protein
MQSHQNFGFAPPMIPMNLPSGIPLPPSISNGVIPPNSEPDKHKYFKLFKEGKFSDFTIVFKGSDAEKEFKVHKNILYFSWEWFKSLTNWDELGTISLEESISCTLFEEFLLFLYTDSILPQTRRNHGIELYMLADKYLVPSLEKLIVNELHLVLSTDNIRQYIKLGKRFHHDQLLATNVTSFIANHAKELSEKNFPFHRLGKLVNPLIKQLIQSTGYARSYYPVALEADNQSQSDWAGESDEDEDEPYISEDEDYV